MQKEKSKTATERQDDQKRDTRQLQRRVKGSQSDAKLPQRDTKQHIDTKLDKQDKMRVWVFCW